MVLLMWKAMLLVSFAGVCLGTSPPFDFLHRAFLDPYENYLMLWTPQEESIVIEIQIRTTHGYVGLGFSPKGGMAGADIVAGWIGDDGTVRIWDAHAIGNSPPLADKSQDYELLAGYRNDTHTVIRFKRQWDTCDRKHDLKITEDTIRVIWAYGDSTVSSGQVRIQYHGENRGTKSIYLKNPVVVKIPEGEDILHWDLLSDKITLPSNTDTLYWCRIMQVPRYALEKKHHLIGNIPIIEKKNAAHVHHFVIYQCHEEATKMEKWVAGAGVQCYSPNMPETWTSCVTPIAAWAVGGHGESLPDHVGLPLGEKFGGSDYYMFEVHYDNPLMKEGITDSSGIRFFLTSNLRKYDAGILHAGHSVLPWHVIPPHQQWHTVGHCSADCTSQSLPADGINITGGLLHTHLLGTGLNLRHIQNGVELRPIMSDMNYDFNYQQTHYVKEETVFLPGDELILDCFYDSRTAAKPVFGGFGTAEEMCLVFLTYYPKIELNYCTSHPDIDVLLDSLHVTVENFDFYDLNANQEDSDQQLLDLMSSLDTSVANATDVLLSEVWKNAKIVSPVERKGQSVHSLLFDENTWKNEALLHKLQDGIVGGKYKNTCYYVNATSLQKVHTLTKRPPDFIPYKPSGDKCHNILK